MKTVILISIGAVFVLTACSSPILRTTYPPTVFSEPQIGTVYYLPKGLIPITISIEKETQKGGESQSSGISTTGNGFVNTININNTNSQILKSEANGNGNNGNGMKYSISMTVGDLKYVPDFNFPYFLEYNPKIGTNDEVTIGIGANQLLTMTKSKSADQTGPILTALAELAGRVAQLVVTGGTMPLAPSADKDKRAKESCPEVKPLKLTTFLDPSASPSESYDFSAKYIEEQLRKASPSISLDVKKLSDTTSNPPGYCLDEDAACLTWYKEEENFKIPGIVFRSLALYSITLKVSNCDECFDAQQLVFSVMAPNDGQVFVVDVSRTPLVEQMTNLTIANGMLSQIDLNKPSTLLAGVKIPLDILKAIASVPNDILTLRIKKIQDEGTLTKAQSDALLNEMNRLKNEKALEQQRNSQGAVQ